MINNKLNALLDVDKMVSEIEIAKRLFRGLEMRTSNYRQEHITRLLCIQELLKETRKQIRIETDEELF